MIFFSGFTMWFTLRKLKKSTVLLDANAPRKKKARSRKEAEVNRIGRAKRLSQLLSNFDHHHQTVLTATAYVSETRVTAAFFLSHNL